MGAADREDRDATIPHPRSFHARIYQGRTGKPEDHYVAISRLCEEAGRKLVSLLPSARTAGFEGAHPVSGECRLGDP